MLRLIPVLALFGCTLATDFDRAFPIQPDARRIDAGEHDRLAACRVWCDEYIPCIAAACGQGVSGPEVAIGIGFCLAQCVDGIYEEYADAIEPTRACNMQTSTDRRRQMTCAQQLLIDCEYLCESDQGSILQACYGVDDDCKAKCEGLPDKEFRCTGYEISALSEPERMDIQVLCDTIKPCLTWPQD